jgi:hypothetical protein
MASWHSAGETSGNTCLKGRTNRSIKSSKSFSNNCIRFYYNTLSKTSLNREKRDQESRMVRMADELTHILLTSILRLIQHDLIGECHAAQIPPHHCHRPNLRGAMASTTAAPAAEPVWYKPMESSSLRSSLSSPLPPFREIYIPNMGSVDFGHLVTRLSLPTSCLKGAVPQTAPLSPKPVARNPNPYGSGSGSPPMPPRLSPLDNCIIHRMI